MRGIFAKMSIRRLGISITTQAAASPRTAQGRAILLLQAQEQQDPRPDAGPLRGEAVPPPEAGTERKAAQGWKALGGKGPCVL